MKLLGRTVLQSLRTQVQQGSPAVVTAAAAAGWLHNSIRYFSSEEASGDTKRLYVGNLNFDTTEQSVHAAFEKYGKVHALELPKRYDGRHRGFGFVQMDTAAADAAVQALNESELDGRYLQVRDALERAAMPPRPPRSSRPPRDVPSRPGFTRLYVGNLSFRTTAADLGRHFQQYGAVQDCVIPLDAAGRSRGFGFVELDSASATAALSALDGSEFGGRNIVVRDAMRETSGNRRDDSRME